MCSIEFLRVFAALEKNLPFVCSHSTALPLNGPKIQEVAEERMHV